VRTRPYQSDAETLEDVLRLSKGMTYKSAMAAIALGGGKSVIICDPREHKTEALFFSFGRFVDELGGSCIAAEDVSTLVDDLEMVRRLLNRGHDRIGVIAARLRLEQAERTQLGGELGRRVYVTCYFEIGRSVRRFEIAPTLMRAARLRLGADQHGIEHEQAAFAARVTDGRFDGHNRLPHPDRPLDNPIERSAGQDFRGASRPVPRHVAQAGLFPRLALAGNASRLGAAQVLHVFDADTHLEKMEGHDVPRGSILRVHRVRHHGWVAARRATLTGGNPVYATRHNQAAAE